MKITISISLLMAVALALFCSCGRGKATASLPQGDTIRMEYAERLKMTAYGKYTVVSLADPWHEGQTLHTYILADKRTGRQADKTTLAELQAAYPEATVVNVPLKRAVVTTSVHCGLIMRLGRGESIRGVCDLRYINLPWIRRRHEQGAIADCGSGITPTLETIIDIDADAVLISPFQNSGGYGRLDGWGRPIIETADYMETSALGRAEWMKFYGMLFGAEKQADSLFTVIENNYNQLKATAKQAGKGSSVIIDKVNGAVWYVPGGNSTIGGIIADANAAYPFAADKSSGSVPLTFEAVMEKASEADVWLFRYNSKQPATYQALASEHDGYSLFKAFKQRQVYGCNTYYNTFYEDTPFSPDLLLRDFVIITHTELQLRLGAPKYFIPLK